MDDFAIETLQFARVSDGSKERSLGEIGQDRPVPLVRARETKKIRARKCSRSHVVTQSKGLIAKQNHGYERHRMRLHDYGAEDQ